MEEISQDEREKIRGEERRKILKELFSYLIHNEKRVLKLVILNGSASNIRENIF